MIKTVSLHCPDCGASVNIEENRKSCFCFNCGAKILIDDGTITMVHHEIDEARIKEAEVKQTIKEREYELEGKKNKRKIAFNLCFLVFWIISLIALIVLSRNTPDNVGAGPYLLVLILDIILGARVIRRIIEVK